MTKPDGTKPIDSVGLAGLIGIGTDIVSTVRMRHLYARYPKRLPGRILHTDEMKDFSATRDKGAFLARRFAAKEAVVKALGCGFSSVPARGVAITRDRNGKPSVKLPEHIDGRVLISIADEKEYATASAVLLSDKISDT